MADKKSKSPKAYAHYLQTGTIYGYYEGAVRRGSGRPPTDPLGPEEFDLVASRLPKPPPRIGTHVSEPSDLARANVQRMINELNAALKPKGKPRSTPYTPSAADPEPMKVNRSDRARLRSLMDRLPGDK